VTRPPLPALSALALVLLAACGTGDSGPAPDNGESAKPAGQILKDSVAAMRTAQSVHIVGEIATGKDVLGMDLHFDHTGNTEGSVTLSGTRADIVVTGGRTYLRGRQLFAAYGDAQIAQTIGDRWVVLPGASGPGSDIVQELSEFTDFNRLADILATPTGGAVTKGAVSTVGGRSVVALRSADGTLYVATTGKPYPVEVSPDAGAKPLHFLSWDAALSVRPPADALDLSALTGPAPAGPSPTP